MNAVGNMHGQKILRATAADKADYTTDNYSLCLTPSQKSILATTDRLIIRLPDIGIFAITKHSITRNVSSRREWLVKNTKVD